MPDDGAFLTAPDGNVFLGLSTSREYNSFADLSNTLFGDWTATEHPTTGSDRSYVVRIAPFTLADVFSQTPVITSPVPGSTIPPDFVLKWLPNGSTNSRGLSYGTQPVSVLLRPSLELMARFRPAFILQLLEPPPVPFSLSASVQSFRPNPIVVSGSPSLNGQSIIRSLAFNSYSLRATYQIVPEPTATVLISIDAFGVCLSCSRRVSGPRALPMLIVDHYRSSIPTGRRMDEGKVGELLSGRVEQVPASRLTGHLISCRPRPRSKPAREQGTRRTMPLLALGLRSKRMERWSAGVPLALPVLVVDCHLAKPVASIATRPFRPLPAARSFWQPIHWRATIGV